MEKENLLLVHSFPTNSLILQGLIEYLDNFFKVYPMDLPGFTRSEPRLKSITLRNYSKFVDEKIKKLRVGRYIIGGISFGFIVVTNAKLDENCEGVVAIEPYVGPKSLSIKPWTKLLYLVTSNLIYLLRLSDIFWKETVFAKLNIFTDHPEKIRKLFFSQIDGATFFKTLSLLIHSREKCFFHDLPYVLVINPEDKKVKYDYILKLFNKGVKELMVIKTVIPHFPADPNEDYFENKIRKEDLKRAVDFLKSKKKVSLAIVKKP